MTSASQTYYNAYAAETTQNNVQPIVSKMGEKPVMLDGETWENRRDMTNKWGDLCYGPVYVAVSNMGRVMETQSVMRGMSAVIAIHRTMEDYLGFRRAMPINMYLNG